MSNRIDILCLQEVEVESGYDPVSLNLKDYHFELEVNSVKSRTGIYIKKSIAYKRMHQLEGIGSHINVIDLKESGTINLCLVGHRFLCLCY